MRFARPGMRIDLGGFAKGHAVDNAAAILRAHGIAHAIGQRRRRQPRHRRPPRAALDDRRARSAPGRRCRGDAAARGRLDLHIGRLRALFRCRRRALPSPHRSGDRPLAARGAKRDGSCRGRPHQRGPVEERCSYSAWTRGMRLVETQRASTRSSSTPRARCISLRDYWHLRLHPARRRRLTLHPENHQETQMNKVVTGSSWASSLMLAGTLAGCGSGSSPATRRTSRWRRRRRSPTRSARTRSASTRPTAAPSAPAAT